MHTNAWLKIFSSSILLELKFMFHYSFLPDNPDPVLTLMCLTLTKDKQVYALTNNILLLIINNLKIGQLISLQV